MQLALESLHLRIYDTRKSLFANLTKGLLISLSLHGMIIASYYFAQLILAQTQKITTVRFIDANELSTAPPLDKEAKPIVKVETPEQKLPIVSGIPVIVADELADVQQTLQSQDELKIQPITSGIGEGVGEVKVDISGALDALSTGSTFGDEPDMNTFVPVEQYPVLIQKINPEYPELARKASMEGKVIAKALIDENGDVIKVVVVEGDEIFKDPAVQSLYKCKFKPAINGNRAVKVWITYPFFFRLK